MERIQQALHDPEKDIKDTQPGEMRFELLLFSQILTIMKVL